jgi:hypothetical protein
MWCKLGGWQKDEVYMSLRQDPRLCFCFARSGLSFTVMSMEGLLDINTYMSEMGLLFGTSREARSEFSVLA